MTYAILKVPQGCVPQKTDLKEFEALAEKSPDDIVAFFRDDINAGKRILGQSYNKRYTPSTFIEEVDGGYQVGWYDNSRHYIQRFTDFAEAVADYILFSFGRGRLKC
ncbi:MAG: hypothetical protein ABSH16_10930 [Sedimentisphaerales bacterium]